VFAELIRPRVPFAEQTTVLPRDEAIRRGRIAVLDDEFPEVLRDLKNRGLAVDHIFSTEDPNFHRLELAFYDVLLLDYGGIGRRFGSQEGLDVLRHLKRVNPSLIIMAFTGRTFDADKADFFRKCDGVIKKDIGIRETLEELEGQLQKALTPAFQWKALCATLTIDGSSKNARVIDKRLQHALRAPRKHEALKSLLIKIGGAAAGTVAEHIALKLIAIASTHVAN
jgi:CheY-like chemotaxis protein